MSKLILRHLYGLIYAAILLSAPWTASGIVVDPDKTAKDTDSLFEALLQANDFDSPSQFAPPSIHTAEQAQQTIQALEQRLRKMGDIAAIAVLSPQIIALVPNDPTIHSLYAIALAAQGDVSTASNLLINLEPTEKTRLYAFLARSAIAKAEGKLTEAANTAEQAIALDSTHPFAYNLLGQIRVAQGNYEDAIKNFKIAVEHAPKFVAAHSNLGAVHYLQGDNAKAWQSFSQSVELSPGFCPALIGRAALASELGNTAGARDDLKTCLNSNPKQLQARKRLTALYLQNGQLDKAMAEAKAAIGQEPGFTRMTLAEIHLRKNQPVAAREQLIDIKSQDAQTKYLLSFCDILEGNLRNALNNIEQAEQLLPDSPTLKVSALIYAFYAGKPVGTEGLNSLIQDPAIGALAAFVAGNIHASQNNFKEAARYWSQAGDLLPGFMLKGLTLRQIQDASSTAEQRHLSMGMLLYLKSYYVAALSEFSKAIAANPDSFMANFFSALTLAQTSDSNKKTNYLFHSIKKAPGFFPANYMLAEYYLNQGDVDNAVKYYRMAAESEPDQGVLVKLGLLYEGQGKVEAAEKTYQRFIDHHSASFLGYNQLAWLYAKQGKKLDEAIQLAKKADNLRPENSSVNDTIGWIYFQKKNYNQADKYLQKANKISKGKNPDILFHLAAVQYKQGNTQAAKTHLKQALAISDSFESIKDAKQLMSNIQAAEP